MHKTFEPRSCQQIVDRAYLFTQHCKIGLDPIKQRKKREILEINLFYGMILILDRYYSVVHVEVANPVPSSFLLCFASHAQAQSMASGALIPILKYTVLTSV